MILCAWLINIIAGFKLRSKQPPVYDNQYRQADVPPQIAAIWDVPSYGKKALFKWNEYVRANTYLLAQHQARQREVEEDLYRQKLDRLSGLDFFMHETRNRFKKINTNIEKKEKE
jgi:hypothetical protein